MYPITLGANIGTTITGLLAAFASASLDSLQVALSHLFFNVSGIILWYPIPFMRRVPMAGARGLGRATKVWKGFPFLYIAVAFFLGPLLLLAISSLIGGSASSVGMKAFGILLAILVTLGALYLVYWWWFKGGKQRCGACLARRQLKGHILNSLPEHLEAIDEDLVRLKEHTALPEKEADEGETEGVGKEFTSEHTVLLHEEEDERVGLMKWIKNPFKRKNEVHESLASV